MKESSVGSIARYSLSRVFMRLLGLVNAFIKPKLLSPELFGLWSLLNVVLRYAKFAHLGSTVSMRYQIPYHLGRDEEDAGRDVGSTVFKGSFSLYFLISAAIVAFAAVEGDLDPKIRWGLATVGVLLMLDWYYEYALSHLKSYQDFRLITSSNYLKASLTLLLSVPLIILFNIYGVYLSAALSSLAVNIYLSMRISWEPLSRFRPRLFAALIRKGLPIMAFDFSTELLKSLDKIIVASFLGAAQLGYYSLAVMVFSFIRQIPGSARDVIEPQMMQSMGSGTSENLLDEYLFKPLINTAYYLTYLIGACFFVVPVFIPAVLPKYAPSVVPTQVVVVGSYFLALVYLLRGVVVAHDWQLKALVPLLPSLAANAGVSILLVESGFGLVGVAIGSSLSYGLLFVLLFVFVEKRCDYDKQKWRMHARTLLWPFPAMCVTLWLVETVRSSFTTNVYVSAIIGMCVFSAAMTMLIIVVRNRCPLLAVFSPGRIMGRRG